MLKIIAVSDNHNESGILYDIAETHDDADSRIHLGDSEFAYTDTELAYYQRVKGNCDFYPEFPVEDIARVGKSKCFFTHGHMYGVNQTRATLARTASEAGCQFAFYGHTHIAKYEHIDGVHVINPGSISQSRSQTWPESYADIHIDESAGHVTLHFRDRTHYILATETFEL